MPEHRTGRLPRWLVWLLGAKVVGVAVAMAVYVTLAIVAALIVTGIGEGEGEGPGSMGVAVVSDTRLTDLPVGEVSVDSPSVSEESLADTPAVEALDATIAAELGGIEADLSTIATGLSGSGGQDAGAGAGLGGAGGGGAKFFGVEARGSRIAYIVDRSGSMRGEKIEQTQIELYESIHTLLEHMSFYVVLFSTESYPLGGRTDWVEASDEGKDWARRHIRAIDVGGGTNPAPALDIVFSMRPRPDAIYLMTDGAFMDAEAIISRLANVNKGRNRIPIHCIAFGTDPQKEVLQQIAKDSGGTFAEVSAP